MKSKLNFYAIDIGYIEYLKKYENKIPNIKYDKHDKFVCGIVFKVNGLSYFAPVSSFKKQQKTNFLIKNENNIPISSIRFSFMFPVPEGAYEELKIREQKPHEYRRLLDWELRYCNSHYNTILKKAEYIYSNQRLKDLCCDFSLLEEKCKEYKRKIIKNKNMDKTSILEKINDFKTHNNEPIKVIKKNKEIEKE